MSALRSCKRSWSRAATCTREHGLLVVSRARGHAGTRSAKTDILVAAASSNPDKTLLLFPEKSSVDITSITDVDATLEREGLVSRVRLDMGKAGGTDKETDTHTRRDKRAANGPNSWTVILIDGSWRQVIVAL